MNEKTIYELRSLPIPSFLYKENGLTLVATKVYCFIHAYTNPFFFGNEHLAEMFGCSTQAISDAIKLLQEKKYIICEYKPKAGGGKIRLVIDDYSENKQMTSRKIKTEATTSHLLIDKDIKDNNIKRETLNGVSSLSYLKNIPLEDLVEFTTSFNCNQTQVKDKALGLYDYCEAKGRRYKNYKAFLRNALRRDYPKLPNRTTHEGMEDHGYINMSQLPGRQDDI